MYLLETNVISEARKGRRALPAYPVFFRYAASPSLFISVITVGEIRRGIELLGHRGDVQQAGRLEDWLTRVMTDFETQILDFSRDEAQVWGRLCVPHPENAVDKQIAATALTHELTLVTRNTAHFAGRGLELLNPFA